MRMVKKNDMLSLEYLLLPIFFALNNSSSKKIGFLILLLYPAMLHGGCTSSKTELEPSVSYKIDKVKLEPLNIELNSSDKKKNRRYVMVLSVEIGRKLRGLKEPHPYDERRENN